MANDAWLESVETMVERFSKKHSHTYTKKKRELSASFEIGCFHTLLGYYRKKGFILSVNNLTKDNEFRYLTTPSGNPANFSYVVVRVGSVEYEIRQQLKIYSHLDDQIAFSPDLAVVKRNTTIEEKKDPDYANGKRPFYRVSNCDVIAAHECKSLPPFPELMVSFIGMYITAHTWHSINSDICHDNETGLHLAPTLFVGGHAKGLHLKMIRAIENTYPINIVVGLHSGTWDLESHDRILNKLKVDCDDISALTLDNLLIKAN